MLLIDVIDWFPGADTKRRKSPRFIGQEKCRLNCPKLSMRLKRSDRRASAARRFVWRATAVGEANSKSAARHHRATHLLVSEIVTVACASFRWPALPNRCSVLRRLRNPEGVMGFAPEVSCIQLISEPLQYQRRSCGRIVTGIVSSVDSMVAWWQIVSPGNLYVRYRTELRGSYGYCKQT
jgi:hypothetical protein